VQSITVHENFSKGALFNDVALLFLAGAPLELAPNINTVCLPPQDHSFENQRCFASGWGKDIFGKEGKYQVILKKVELPIVPHAKCQTNMRTTRLGARFNLHNSFVCAGGEKGKDTCKGDGGSPLVCPVVPGTFDRYYQTGVVAWVSVQIYLLSRLRSSIDRVVVFFQGIGCGENNIPGVYGKVSLFRNWIDQQFTAKKLDKKFYIA
jgi:plasma kallikrein